MKKYLILNVIFLFFCALGHTTEECHVFFVQIADSNPLNDDQPSLNEEEQAIVEGLAADLTAMNFAAIYCSDNPLAIQTAQILATYHDCPVFITPVLGNFTRMKIFKMVGPLRKFGEEIYLNNNGKNIACVIPESLMNFIGRYIHGGFTTQADFTYLHVNSNGAGLYLSP
ncbi:MAG: histidine phosphatase family protein [Parachlamydiaceae bacterium]